MAQDGQDCIFVTDTQLVIDLFDNIRDLFRLYIYYFIDFNTIGVL